MFKFLVLWLSAFQVMATPFCVAHRGNSSEKLENSLAALESAARMNVQAIEFDIHHTRDNVAILNHDATLERTVQNNSLCRLNDPIGDLTYLHIEQHCRLKNGQHIPTLEDALALLSRFPVMAVIELKDMPTVEDMTLIRHYFGHNPQNVMIISFKKKALERVQNFKQVFPFLNAVKLLKLFLKTWGSKTKFDGINASWISKRKIQKYKDSGKMVGAWTKNSASMIQRYFERGVDFVTSNYPARCLKVVENL